MTKQVQFRRGSAIEHSTFTGAEGEVTVDTTNYRLVVHDGVTPGGHPVSDGPYQTTDITGRIIKNNNGILQIDGHDIREFGVNFHRLIKTPLYEYWELDDTNYNWTYEFKQVVDRDIQDMANFDIRHVRAFAGPHNLFELVNWYSDSNKINKSMEIIRKVLDLCHDRGIGVMLSMFPVSGVFCEHFGETLEQSLSADSQSFNHYMSMVDGFLTLADHPALAAWEIANEWNFNLTQDFGHGTVTLSTRRAFFDAVQARITSVDTTGRIITNGDTGPWGFQDFNSIRSYGQSVLADNPGALTPSGHTYNDLPLHTLTGENNKDFYIRLRRDALSANKAYVVGEYGYRHDKVEPGQSVLDYSDDLVATNDGIYKTHMIEEVTSLHTLRNQMYAAYNAGIQLAYLWDWGKWFHMQPDMSLHPDYPAGYAHAKMAYEFVNIMNKARNQPSYIDPNTLTLDNLNASSGKAISVPSTSEFTCMSVVPQQHLLHDTETGYTVSFWFKVEDDMVGQSHRTIVEYRDSVTRVGFSVALVKDTDNTDPDHTGKLWFHTSVPVENGSMNDHHAYAMSEVMLDGKWHHVTVQWNNDPTHMSAGYWEEHFTGMVAYVDGYKQTNYLAKYGAPVFVNEGRISENSALLSIFAAANSISVENGLNEWSSWPGKFSIKDLTFYNKPLPTRDMWLLSRYDLIPSREIKAKWSFNDTLADASNNNTFTVHQLNGVNVGPSPIFIDGPNDSNIIK